MTNRNASDVMFGFSFQANAGIMLMLKNIKELDSIRLEGAKEDIEINLSTGKKIFAQVKAVVRPYNDFKNVRQKFSQAIVSLAEAEQSSPSNTKQLIYVTNSSNPLNEENLRSRIYLETILDYNNLPPETQSIIDEIIEKQNTAITKELLHIYVVPFATDDLKERHKFIKKGIEDFLSAISPSYTQGICPQLMQKWQQDLFNSGTLKDTNIKLTKKEITWSLIFVLLENRTDNSFFEQFDRETVEAMENVYDEIIKAKTERWDFCTKIIYDYKLYSINTKMPRNEILSSFINSRWLDLSEIENVCIEEELHEVLIKTILYTVLTKKKTIEKVKEYVNL